MAQVEEVEKAWEGFKEFRFLPMVVFRFLWPIFCWARDVERLVRAPIVAIITLSPMWPNGVYFTELQDRFM